MSHRLPLAHPFILAPRLCDTLPARPCSALSLPHACLCRGSALALTWTSQVVQLQIWDTAGQERFHAGTLGASFYRGRWVSRCGSVEDGELSCAEADARPTGTGRKRNVVRGLAARQNIYYSLLFQCCVHSFTSRRHWTVPCPPIARTRSPPLPRSDGAVIVYDVTDAGSFDQVCQLCQLCRAFALGH